MHKELGEISESTLASMRAMFLEQHVMCNIMVYLDRSREFLASSPQEWSPMIQEDAFGNVSVKNEITVMGKTRYGAILSVP